MSVPLSEAVKQYLASLKPEDRQRCQPELLRLERWLGPDRDVAGLRGQEVASYAESIADNVRDAAERVDAVRRFLAFLHKRQWASENLARHVPVRRTGVKRASPAPKAAQVADEVHLTPEGHAALLRELEELKEKRVHIAAELKRAMADKDFRENAPLDAARDAQGHLERRIREIEATLKRAVIVTAQDHDGQSVRIGSTVVLHNLQSQRELRYTLVSPSEVDPRAGKISTESPVGKALLHRREGEEIEVEAPSGVQRFRIERIEAPS
ncbi:MAG TPA: transcription elongation factor GreA [Dehalococcoidia bacterium]|nr:transcription elongation factor GreA [Dehalococcoidia bacterium]